MAVNDLARKVLYTGDGTTKTFTYAFVVFVETDVAVYQKDGRADQLINAAQYSVAINADQDANPGGSVTFVTAPAAGTTIALVSKVPYTQPMVLTPYDGFEPRTLNKEADRLESQIQQLKRDAGRALKVPLTSTDTPEELMDELFDIKDDAAASAAAAATSASQANNYKNQAAASAAAAADAAENVADILPYKNAIATIAPYTTEIDAVAERIEAVQDVHQNMPSVLVVADDLDAIERPNVIDYGDIDDPVDAISSGQGNIVTVAQDIENVDVVAQNITNINNITQTVQNAAALLAQINQAKADTLANAQNAASSKTAAEGYKDAAGDSAFAAQNSAAAAQAAAAEAADYDTAAAYYAGRAEDSATDAASSAGSSADSALQAQLAMEGAIAAAAEANDRVQSDWQEPDSTEASYIRNRTHYIIYTKQATYTELLDEETFTRYPDDRTAPLTEYIPIDPEKTYKIIFDGVTYEDVGANFLFQDSSCGCGDAQADEDDFETYPFLLFPMPCGLTTRVFTETSGQHTIAIYEKGYEWVQTGVQKLDPMYLPIATTSALGAVIVGNGLAVTQAGVLSTSFDIATYATRTWVLEQIAGGGGGGGDIDLSDYAKLTDLDAAIAQEVLDRNAAIAAAMASVVHTEITAAEVETAWEAA